MTIKTAAFLALVGTALLTVLLTWNLVVNFSGVARGFIPAITLLISLVQWLASLSLLVFFTVFYNKQ